MMSLIYTQRRHDNTEKIINHLIKTINIEIILYSF